MTFSLASLTTSVNKSCITDLSLQAELSHSLGYGWLGSSAFVAGKPGYGTQQGILRSFIWIDALHDEPARHLYDFIA